MSTVTGIDANIGQTIQVDSSKLINTYMPEGWTEMISSALSKAMAEREASGEGPRNGINALIDGEYHFFSFESAGSRRRLSAGEAAAFQQQYAENPCMNTLWKILAEMSRMGVVDGFAAFHEYTMAQRREQQGGDSFGIVPAGATGVAAVLSRLDNVLYGISIDRSRDAAALRDEAEKYQNLRELIRLIAGA